MVLGRLRRATVILGRPGIAGTGITEAEKIDLRAQVQTAQTGVNGIPAAVASAVAASSTVVNAAAAAAWAAVQRAGGPVVQRGVNLYNGATAISGYTLEMVGGTLAANAGYVTSDYIPVKAGQPYTFSAAGGAGPRNLAFYTTAMAFVTGFNNTTSLVTTQTPAQDGYVRASYSVANAKSAQVEAGTTATAYQAYREEVPALRVGAQNLPALVVTPAATSFAQAGKNKYNPAADGIGFYVNENNGIETPFANYRTSEYISVTGGQPYTITLARKVAFYDQQRRFLSGLNVTQGAAVTVTPPQDGYVRFSYTTTGGGNVAAIQFETGSTATPYEPYSVTLPAMVLTADQKASVGSGGGTPTAPRPVSLTKAGETFTISTALGGAGTLAIATSRTGSANGAFGFVSDSLNGLTIHGTSDDITPIRTFTTVGGNHGYTCISVYTVAGHGKTTADLGSIYSDGTRQYTLLAIAGNDLTFGHPYSVSGGVVTGLSAAPAATLTHVSGGTATGSVPITTKVAGAQLYPSIGNVSVRYLVDGMEVTANGAIAGDRVQVIESYTIHDYKALIDWAQTHIGQSYTTAPIEGVVRIGNVYTFRSEGRCTVASSLTALKKVTLGDTGFLQSTVLSASGYTARRYMPRVKPKGGVDFGQLVDLTSYSTSLLFGPADYLDPTKPPSRYVDWLVNGSGQKVVGFTMGYITDKTNSRDSDRAALATGWDMRGTKKSYPVALSGVTLEAGEHRSIEGFRNYLAPPPAGATAVTTVPDEAATYVYVDSHAPVTALPVAVPDRIGRPITVLESVGATVLNDVAGAEGVVVTIPAAGRVMVKVG